MVKTQIEIGNILLTVESNNYLTNDTIEEIKELNLAIYFNDLSSSHWSYDAKLNSGHWLENITYNNELTQGKALILN